MENFKNFEIENQDMIFGGSLTDTEYTGGNGTMGKDKYDSDRDAVVYLPSER